MRTRAVRRHRLANQSRRRARFRARLALARVRRSRLNVPVIAVTGTAGKTTTREMIRRILSLGRRVEATPGNRNDDPTLPLLRAGPQTGAVVAEVGLDHPGRIAWECRILRPTIGVITNIGPAHVEACGGFMGVVRAKNELVHGLEPTGTLVLNADDRGTRLLDLTRFRGRIIRFGRADGADYRLVTSRPTERGDSFTVWAEGASRDFILNVPGEHLLHDALAAIAVARAAGADWPEIRRGLAAHVPVGGRQSLQPGIRGSLIIDGTYNANPLSVRAGLQTLRQLAKGRPTLAVLGGMAEQGTSWRRAHRGVGRAVVENGIDALLTVGSRAAAISAGALAAGLPRVKVRSVLSRRAAIALLRRTLPYDSVVLIKGSHSAGLKQVVNELSVNPEREQPRSGNQV